MTTGLGRLAALAAACAVLAAFGAGAGRAADIGANDDTVKYEADGGLGLYGQMAALGLRQTILTVRFQPSDPTAVPGEEMLDAAVRSATASGLHVVLAAYPYPPRELLSGSDASAAFGDWLGGLARRYPTVRQFVVGNEPNQAAFMRPQFGRRGRNLSAATAGRYLAAGYDALKAVDPSITVVGVGLSPRGNDDPHAPTNSSTSPMRFLAALGRWYRTSGRTLPLMDGFSFHPYPRQATDPLARGYTWPNAGFVDLARVKQGLWDAFHGTAQPTTVDGLKLYLDEVGWQVATAGSPAYTGRENVPVTTEATQAAIYGALVREAACDEDVAAVNFFGFHDDSLRTGFQSGLYRADGTARPAADAVRTAIAETALGICPAHAPWAPATGVVGASAEVAAPAGGQVVTARTPLELVAAAVAAEGSTATVSVERLPALAFAGVRSAKAARVVASGAATVLHPPGTARLRVSLPAGLAPGRYTVAVTFTAEGDRRRTTVVRGLPFRVR